MGKQKKICRDFYLISFLQFFAVELIGTTLMIFFLYKGLNAYQGNIIIAAFAVTVFLMETPTGIIADLLGRRISVVSGMVIQAIAYYACAITDSFYVFLVCNIMLGIAYTLKSGALEAWAVDYIKYNDKNADIGNLFSRVFAIRNSAGIFCGILGGYLAQINMSLPYYWSVGFIALTIVFTVCVMKEPYFVRKKHSEKMMKNMVLSTKEIARDSFNYGFKNKYMLIVMVVGMIMAFSNSSGNAFQQHRMLGLSGYGPWILGWMKAGYSLLMMLGAWLVGYLNRRLTMNKVIGIACFMIGFWLVLSGTFNTFWSVAITFNIYEIGRGMLRPAVQTYLNQKIEGDKRATILSFSSALSQFGMVLGLLVTGRMNKAFNSLGADQNQIRLAWVICGIIALAASLISIVGLKEKPESVEISEGTVN